MSRRRLFVGWGLFMAIATADLLTPRDATAKEVQLAGCSMCMQGLTACPSTAEMVTMCYLWECDYQTPPVCGNLGNCQLPDRFITCLSDPE